MTDQTFDVALSFAAEDRNVARTLAELLSHRGVRVFYDTNETAELWGKDLHRHLQAIYAQSRFVVVFLSRAYMSKSWTQFEARSAIARAGDNIQAQVLPLRLDDVELPSLAGILYVDLRNTALQEVAELIARRVRNAPGMIEYPSLRALPVHVIPSEGRWIVKQGGKEKSSNTWPTKDEAVQVARALARSAHVEVILHRPDGTVESRDFPRDN